eukprot:SAG11_NODE_26_length_23420_cov_40.459886_24_plen_63_part_00
MNRTTSAAIDTTFDKLAHELNSYEIRAYEARVRHRACERLVPLDDRHGPIVLAPCANVAVGL